MLWSRSRHLLLAIAALAAIPLGWMAGGAGRLGDLPSIVALELAGTAERAGSIVHTWAAAGARPTAISAVCWDFAFLCAYGLAGVLAAAALGRRAPPAWDSVGLAAAGTVGLAAACDFVENIVLLHVLDGSLRAAPLAAVLAWAKFALLALALAGALTVAVVAAVRRRAEPSSLDWSLVAEVPDDSGLLNCDLVMKGSITSGVVYPGAVVALARRYRFRNIGGSSAGAISAAITAAAEYRRRSTRSNAGFLALRDITASLARDDRLFRLFQPARPCAALFDVMTSALRGSHLPVRLGWVAVTAPAAFPLATLAAFAPATVLLATGGVGSQAPSATALAVLASALLTAVLLPACLLAAAALRVVRALGTNGFGLCPGNTQPGAPGPGLSDWLADRIDEVAFGKGWEARGPLTLGHLWCGTTPQPEELARRLVVGAPREINLEVLTTSLTHGRPYRIPFDRLPLWFKPEELKQVLPDRIVQAMMREGEKIRHSDRLTPLPPGAVRLPPAEHLPVVFLARMSLSFPFLLSAPKLLGVRFATSIKKAEELPPDEADASRKPSGQERRGEYQPMWFSDGGISSNFPIHFFDAPIPRWPTFGLDLGEAPKDISDQERIRVPRSNNEGILASWLPIESVGDFGTALVQAVQAWLDNMQKRAPGYRERVARLFLTSEEGGINLQMPPERILKIARFGHALGSELGEVFDPAVPAAGKGASGRSFAAWDNHRWVRFRSTMGVVEKMLRSFQRAYGAPPPAGARSYRDMLLGSPPSYQFETEALFDHAEGLTTALLSVQVDPGEGVSNGAPRPEPELRIVPKV